MAGFCTPVSIAPSSRLWCRTGARSASGLVQVHEGRLGLEDAHVDAGGGGAEPRSVRLGADDDWFGFPKAPGGTVTNP